MITSGTHRPWQLFGRHFHPDVANDIVNLQDRLFDVIPLQRLPTPAFAHHFVFLKR